MNQFSIIICTYNRSAFLKETIESILSHYKDNTNIELMIVDNNSTDNTAEVVKPFMRVPFVRYVLEKQQGLSAARNRGIKEAKFSILVFLDDDIDIDATYLTVLDKIYSDPTIFVAGGKVLPYKAQIPEWLPNKYYYLASVLDLGNTPKYVPKLMGANHTFRKEVATKVGDYNVKIGPLGNFKLGGDEDEFLYRAKQKGYQILYHPDLIVYHKIANRFNKEFILEYAFNIGASQANIDLEHNRFKLGLKVTKYITDTVINRMGFFKGIQDEFVHAIRKEHKRGYLNFIKNSIGIHE